MVEVRYKEGLKKEFKNVKSIAKSVHNLAATLDLLTLNGTESGPLECTHRQYNQILAEVHGAILNLELTEKSLKKYINQ